MKKSLGPVFLSVLSAVAACNGSIMGQLGSDGSIQGGTGGTSGGNDASNAGQGGQTTGGGLGDGPGGGGRVDSGGQTDGGGPGAGGRVDSGGQTTSGGVGGGPGGLGGGGRVDSGTGTGTTDAGAVPVISSFTAAPITLSEGGGPVTLTWSATGATQLSIDNGIGAVTGNSRSTTVTATTIFTLTASNGAGSATRSAVVTVGTAAQKPLILSFSATPASLTAAGASTLNWQVQNATTITIDHGVGAVTGTMANVNVTATTIYSMTATNASGSATATTAVVVGQNPSSHGTRFVAMVAPSSGETFIAPATLRLVGIGRDPNIDTNSPSSGLGGNASKVQFFVDDAVVLEVAGSMAEYYVFKGFAGGIASGAHRVWARAIFVNPAEVLDSPPALITVSAPPTYGQTADLTADVSGTYSLVGTAGARVRLNGNGHRITGTGNLTLKFVDVFNLGSTTSTSQAGVAYTSTGAVVIEDSTFDNSNTISVSLNGTATASIKRNLFRSNMRMPLGQNPDSTAPGSWPVIHFDGSSTGAKAFAGNNVGAGWAEWIGVANWIVGGDTDADSNILIGPRVGIYMRNSSGSVIRRNYSRHVYYGGWSQGSNFELGMSPTNVIEHNVIQGSSWPVRGVAGEFRYNLVLDAGHQWLWADSPGGYIHHNVFLGGEADIAGIYVLYSPTNVRIMNNTIDGLNTAGVMTLMGGGSVTFTSNLLMRAPATVARIDGGTFTTDYNLFFNSSTTNYSDNRKPVHDVGNGAKTDPMLTSPPSVILDVDTVGIWNRSVTVRDILTLYRTRYTPRTGSPVIDVGDPAGGAGNDVGAVGAGNVNAADKFGLF